MGLWDKLMGEFIDVIQWMDDTNDTLVYRFERHGNEIKFGAKLTVREGQVAVFVNEGQLADTFQPGMYELKTNNLPVLSTLQGWKYGFESPFKAEVYFFSTRRFTDLKWGTQNPVMLRDPEFGPIRLRAFGNYAIRIKDAPTFLREIVGTDGRFTTDEITSQLRNMVVSRFTNILGQSKIPALDLAGNYDQLGQFLLQRIAPEFETVGLELTNLLVENISLPKEVEAALDKRSSMGIVGNLDQYTQFQAAEALRDAAANPGGGSEALNMGLGLAMAQRLSDTLARPASAPSAAPAAPPPLAPPPLPTVKPYFVAVNNQQ
ncbi:MAG TPA: SPFH domain-containing protein, partial [Candidatus Competibacteraceae bacterium]|nr:SPFH domain-containing protein [Candidatus Competibacteraceae bacterium]